MRSFPIPNYTRCFPFKYWMRCLIVSNSKIFLGTFPKLGWIPPTVIRTSQYQVHCIVIRTSQLPNKSSLQLTTLNTSLWLFLLQRPIHWLFKYSFSFNSILDTTAQFGLLAPFVYLTLALLTAQFHPQSCLPLQSVCGSFCCNYSSPYWIIPKMSHRHVKRSMPLNNLLLSETSFFSWGPYNS